MPRQEAAETACHGPASATPHDQPAEPVPVQAHLADHLEPHDGRFHWYGRLGPRTSPDSTPPAATR
ncbi:DUF4873 domain-containing protein [Spirillospora sp. NPDC127200]